MKYIAAIIFAFSLSGCGLCTPASCPADEAIILQLEEITTELEAGYTAGLPAPISLEEMLGGELPLETSAGGVLSEGPDNPYLADRMYTLQVLGGEKFYVGYRAGGDGNPPSLSFGYSNGWNAANCFWNSKDPEWFCIKE